MPIRFRCAYCNQMLGIAKRKVGSVVRCPTCAGQVIVPSNDTTEPLDPGEAVGNPLVFERSDFDDLLKPGESKPVAMQKKASLVGSTDGPTILPTTAEPPAGAWGTHAEPAYDVEKLNPSAVVPALVSPAAETVVLTRAKATIFIVGAIVALAIAFGGGLLLGYQVRASQDTTRGQTQ